MLTNATHLPPRVVHEPERISVFFFSLPCSSGISAIRFTGLAILLCGEVCGSCAFPRRLFRGSDSVTNTPDSMDELSFEALINLFPQVVDVHVDDVRHRIEREVPDMLDDHWA